MTVETNPTDAEMLKESMQQTSAEILEYEKLLAIEQQVVADKMRYKSVVEQLLNWSAFAPGENKDAALVALIRNAQNAKLSEGAPLAT